MKLFNYLLAVMLAFSSVTLVTVSAQSTQERPNPCRNLVINGSFEQGPNTDGYLMRKPGDRSIQGWQVIHDTIDYIGTYFPSAHGTRHVDLDGTPGFGGIQQIVTTEPGQKYKLTFSLAGNPQGAPSTKVMMAQAGNVSKRFAHAADTGWTQQTIIFTANSSSTVIAFYSADKEGGYWGPLLDNVQLVITSNDTKEEQENPNFGGKWSSNWGEMTLKQTGNKVSGVYTHDKGHLSGTVSADGKTLNAWWSEYPTYKAPRDAGKALLVLSEDTRSFTGQWGYGNSLKDGSWLASRIAPKQDLAQQCTDEPATPVTQDDKPKKQYVISSINLDDRPWRQKKSDLVREYQSAKQTEDVILQGMDPLADKYLQAQQAAERAKQAKLATDQQFKGVAAQLAELKNPKQEIPKDAKVLVEQRDFLQQEIDKTENRLLAVQKAIKTKQTAALVQERSQLVSSLDSQNEQLARLDSLLKEKLPPLPDNTAQIDALEKQLKALEDQYWDNKKTEARAISDLEIATSVLNDAVDRLKKATDQKLALEKKLRLLDASDTPFIEQVQVTANGKTVYQAQWLGPFDELQKIEKEVRELEAATASLKQVKQDSFDDFKRKAQESMDILASLHGNVSQGNGISSTLKDVFFNHGEIFHNARGQAAADFGMNAYEVFVEGWGRGGPAGALVETMQKVAMAGVEMGMDKVVSTEDYNPDPTHQQINKETGAGLVHPLTTTEVLKTATSRTIEDGVVRHLRDYGNSTVGAKLHRAISQGTRQEFVNMMGRPGVTAAALKAQGAKLNTIRTRLLQLGQPERYSGKELGKNLLKDALKQAVKAHFQEQENAVWERYHLANAEQINLFTVYQNATEAYYQAEDLLIAKKKERDQLVQTYDPRNGFQVSKAEPFKEEDNVSIRLSLKQPNGHTEQVDLSGKAAQAAGNHLYGIQAVDLSNDPQGRLTLNIKQE